MLFDEDISWFRRRPSISEDNSPGNILKYIDRKVILKVCNRISVFDMKFYWIVFEI